MGWKMLGLGEGGKKLQKTFGFCYGNPSFFNKTVLKYDIITTTATYQIFQYVLKFLF